MAHPVLGVDHTYVLVRDLEESAARYRRLGFTLSPRGLHSPEKGTANHTIVFRDDYLELLGIVAETPQNLPQRERLAADGEGLQAIANRTADADAASEALAALGIPATEMSAFSRPLPLPDGREVRASFWTVSLDPSAVPLGHFFLCQHETPEFVWLPELQEHPNGAVALAGIVGIGDDPKALAERYAHFYAEGRVVPSEGGFAVETGPNSATLHFFDSDTAAALYLPEHIAATPRGGFAALRIRVASPERLRHVLDEQGVPYSRAEGGRTIVGPAEASGVIVEFRAG